MRHTWFHPLLTVYATFATPCFQDYVIVLPLDVVLFHCVSHLACIATVGRPFLTATLSLALSGIHWQLFVVCWDSINRGRKYFEVVCCLFCTQQRTELE